MLLEVRFENCIGEVIMRSIRVVLIIVIIDEFITKLAQLLTINVAWAKLIVWRIVCEHAHLLIYL